MGNPDQQAKHHGAHSKNTLVRLFNEDRSKDVERTFEGIKYCTNFTQSFPPSLHLSSVIMVKERDEELALFLKLRIGEQENESNGGHLIASSDEVDAPLGCNPLGSPLSKAIAVPPAIRDEFLDSENDRTDFDWLLSPPRNTIFPPCKSEQNGVIMKNHDRSTALTSLDVENVDIEVVATKKTQVSCGDAAAAAVKKKPSSSESLTSTRRRASSTPRQPVLAAASTNKQPSRITWPCTKPMGPTTRPTSRSSTPTVRSTTAKVVSAPPARSSSASKSRSTASKTTTVLQTYDPTKNLNPKKETRPVSASKVRANYSQSLVAEASSRRRASSGSSERCLSSGRSRRHSNGNGTNGSSEDVNPVLMGTQMVERIVNMRKLARPDQGSYHQVTDGKFSSSIDKSSGFGRSLSKKSLDMAMRHMDISSSVNEKLRSVRLGSRKDHQKSDVESPVTTRSIASSSSAGELVEDIGVVAAR